MKFSPHDVLAVEQLPEGYGQKCLKIIKTIYFF